MTKDEKQTTIFLSHKADKILRKKCYEWDITRKEIWNQLIFLIEDLKKEDVFGGEA